MSVAIQFRRGTTTNHAGFAGLIGELTVDTTKKTICVHDGSTLGGTPLALQVHTHTTTDISGLKYQTIALNGTSQPQQPTLNLSTLFTSSNDIVNNRTTLDFANNNTSGAGTYGSATQVARITVNNQGVITAVTQTTIAGVAPAGTASGDLGGTYPGPSVAAVGGQTAANVASAVSSVNSAASANTPSTLVIRDSSGNFSANVITSSLNGNITGNASGTAASITGNLTGDVTSSGMVTTLGPSGVGAGSYGSATQVPRISVDGKGRVTAVSLQSITGVAPGGSAAGDLSGTYPSPTVATVGGSSASAINTAVTLTNNGTPSATASTLVLRDGGGAAAFTTVGLSIHGVSSSASPTFDLSLGAIQQMTINTNITLTVIGMSVGLFVFDFIHDGTTTAYTITWPANVFTSTANVGIIASKHNNQLFWCDGTNLYELGTLRTNLG